MGEGDRTRTNYRKSEINETMRGKRKEKGREGINNETKVLTEEDGMKKQICRRKCKKVERKQEERKHNK